MLRVEFLGVGGFLLRSGADAVMTAPLYTRPNMLTVETGLPVHSDPAAVDANLPASKLANLRAVLSGHAHYDHLLDVPTVLERAPTATLYSNSSARNVLDAFAPDRSMSCGGTPASSSTINRARVVAMDDPAASVVDYTNCPDLRPAGAPLTGTWVNVPGANMRVYAVCSTHPDQVGPIHFAPGSVEGEQCTAPTRMDAWKEGTTLAFLVDFLDAKTKKPTFRVYYQDAPTNAPIGHIPDAVLSGKRVDLALLCVGSYQNVNNEPTATADAVAPRYALGGHWEDFLQPLGSAPVPIPLLDVPGWLQKARAAMPDGTEPKLLVTNGTAGSARAVLPNPGDVFEIATP